MHVVTRENYGEAADAIRDILLMYVGLAEDGCFCHAVDWPIRFDRLKFIDAVTECGNNAYLVDLDLLRAGSAIAVLCFVYDLWCEFDTVDTEHAHPVREALAQCRFRFVPDVEAVLRKALGGAAMTIQDPWFDQAVRPIHERHVIGYFRRLAGRGISTSDASSRR